MSTVNAAVEANETAEAFARVWQFDTYAGFSRNTAGEATTPFLDRFIAEVKCANAVLPRVLEVGAGSCDHALRCAREGLHVTAVEYSHAAVRLGQERLREHPQASMRIVQADFMTMTHRLEPRYLHGIYANSVFHFLTPQQRVSQYDFMRQALAPDGVLAVSFKSSGDSLHRRGTHMADTPSGAVVRGQDGIPRLFVHNPQPLVIEMQTVNLEVFAVLRWSVPDYNIVNESGEFVGLLARPRQG